MKKYKLYKKDKKWIIQTEDNYNTFTTKKSAQLFSKIYNIELNENS